MQERKFQQELVSMIKRRWPDAVVLKNDPNYLQGVPDLIVLIGRRWFALEVKANRKAHRRPNQDYYVGVMDEMSFASYVHPDNSGEVLDAIQQALDA